MHKIDSFEMEEVQTKPGQKIRQKNKTKNKNKNKIKMGNLKQEQKGRQT